MPQVKIHGTQTFLGQARAQLSEVIHRCMVAGLGVPAESPSLKPQLVIGASEAAAGMSCPYPMLLL